MKTLWNAVSFVAVVNLLALLIFIGWLWQSNRLSSARVEDLRALFAQTLTDEAAAQANRALAIQSQLDRQLQQQLRDDPPIDSASQIRHVSLIKQQEEQARRRLEEDKRMLLNQLAAATAQIAQQHAELERRRTEWESAVGADRKRKIDEQFLQTVKQYEQVSPKQGKKMIAELIEGNQMEMAVAYLDAMAPRAAARIIREFKTDAEIVVATQLLEELRTFGMDAPSSIGGRSPSVRPELLQETAKPGDQDALAHAAPNGDASAE